MEEVYKRNLLSDNRELEFEAISGIRLEFLNIKEPLQRCAYSRTLIDMEIARLLCPFVGASYDEMSRSTLLILRVMSDTIEFYTKNIARRAITHCLRRGHELIQTNADDHLTIPPISDALCAILNGALHYGFSLNTICNIDSLLTFMNGLSPIHEQHFFYILSVTQLYAIFISFFEQIHHEKNLHIILEIYGNILGTANKVTKVLVRNEDSRFMVLMSPITIICRGGLRFYESSWMDDDEIETFAFSEGSTLYRNPLRFIMKVTSETILENVIPNSKSIGIVLGLNFPAFNNFIHCVCELYKCPDVHYAGISLQLAKFGYLKYFHAILDNSKPYYDDLLHVISQVATDASEECLTMDEWDDDPEEFQKFMKTGIMTLADPVSFAELYKKDPFIFLIYIHFHVTEEFNIVDYIGTMSKLNLSRRIMQMAVNDIPNIPTLQVILFTFAASTLGSTSATAEPLFHPALSRITEIVESIGLDICLVDKRRTPFLILDRYMFPNEIPNDVLKLWLGVRNNLYMLVTPEEDNSLIECLLNLASGDGRGFSARCSWKLCHTLETCINRDLSYADQLVQSLWANFPQILASHTEERAKCTETYLEMIKSTAITNLIAIPEMLECAKSIIVTLMRRSHQYDIKLLTLIIQQAAKILDNTLTARDDRVGWFFANNPMVLEKLRVHAYDKEHRDLAAASFQCLAAILRVQRKYQTHCSSPVILYHKNLLAPLMPHNSGYHDVLDFYNLILAGGVERPAVAIAPITRAQIRSLLVEIYRMYCVIHINNHESQWECTFYCLANILRYLSHNYKSALMICCEYVCNIDIMIMAIEEKFQSVRFFDFIRVWLRQSIKRRTVYVREVLASKKERGGVRVWDFSQFPNLKPLYAIEKHVEEAIEVGRLNSKKALELTNYLKKLL